MVSPRRQAGKRASTAHFRHEERRRQGVPQNLWEAHVWFSLAADNGHEEAAEMRDHIAGLLSRDDLASAQAEADRIHAMIQAGLDD